MDIDFPARSSGEERSSLDEQMILLYCASQSPLRMPFPCSTSPPRQHLLPVDVDFPPRSSGEDREPRPLFDTDEETMQLVFASLSPPPMLIPCLTWSPPPPPSPPGICLCNLDDETALSPAQAPVSQTALRPVQVDHAAAAAPMSQTALRPVQVDHAAVAAMVTAPGTAYGQLERIRSCLSGERITRVLKHCRESTSPRLLVQVWAPVKYGDHYVLANRGQPFELDHRSTMLLHLSILSVKCRFYMDSRRAGASGLPHRVLKRNDPKGVPNVQNSSSVKDLRNHATDVRGTVAISVFDPRKQSCISAVGLTMTSEKMNYESAVDKICKELEALSLKSTTDTTKQNVCSLKVLTDGEFGSLQSGDMPVTVNEELKETDAQNPESRYGESPLVLDTSNRPTKRMRGNNDSTTACVDVVQRHPSAQPRNAPKSKFRSKSWNHFTKDGARAYCMHCPKNYAADSKKHGTTRLFKHLEDAHQIYLRASYSKKRN